MILSGITQLVFIGVFDRGVPNKERIVLRGATSVNLGQFGIMLGVATTPGMAVPIKDNLFWFGDGFINRGDWLFVFTSPGEPKSSKLPNSDEMVHTIFWGRKNVLLKNELVVPILIRIDGVTVWEERLQLSEKSLSTDLENKSLGT